MQEINRFNLRVYGLWINSRAEILLTEEALGDKAFVKYPGGGLEYGEGVADCLRREWREETGLELLGARHYYTTEFFQRSAFDPREQIVSIYYLVRADETAPLRPPDGDPRLRGFRWQPLAEPFEPTLPIDREVTRRLLRDRAEGRLA